MRALYLKAVPLCKYVQVSSNGQVFSELGEEGFAIGRVDDGDVLLRAKTPSGSLYGVFRLLSYLQRQKAVPGTMTNPFISIPSMTLRIWDLWDDLSGDITRGFAGDSLVWPMALWKNPDDPSTAPAATKLFVGPCNSSDPLQRWQGDALSQPGKSVSAIRNQVELDGKTQCVATATSTVVSCDSAEAGVLFYNTTALQLSIGPLGGPGGSV